MRQTFEAQHPRERAYHESFRGLGRAAAQLGLEIDDLAGRIRGDYRGSGVSAIEVERRVAAYRQGFEEHFRLRRAS